MKAVFFTALIALFTTSAIAEQMTQQQAYSYTMGSRLGELLKGQGIGNLDIDAFAMAVGDVLEGRPAKLSREQMVEAVTAQQAAERDKRAQAGDVNKQRGAAFLAENAKKAGVVSLSNGMQYRVITQGSGPKPSVTDKVKVHYRGTLIDGTEFDSSYGRGQPSSFSLGGVIAGFREALSLMPVGSKWQVFIPGELAYGERGAGGDIGPNETLIFEMELIEIL